MWLFPANARRSRGALSLRRRNPRPAESEADPRGKIPLERTQGRAGMRAPTAGGGARFLETRIENSRQTGSSCYSRGKIRRCLRWNERKISVRSAGAGLELRLGVARESPVSWLSRAYRTWGFRYPLSLFLQASRWRRGGGGRNLHASLGPRTPEVFLGCVLGFFSVACSQPSRYERVQAKGAL